ncbi:hypothetical protein H0H93_006244, partial [Arthromyces matolae]
WVGEGKPTCNLAQVDQLKDHFRSCVRKYVLVDHMIVGSAASITFVARFGCAVFENSYVLHHLDVPIAKLLQRLEAVQGSREIQEKLLALTPENPDALVGHEIAQLGITLAIVAEHSFFLKKEKPDISFKDSIETALDVYLGSSKSSIIMSTVAALDFSCLGLRKSPIRSLFNTTPAGVLEEAAIARVALHETLVKIVLDNRITTTGHEELLL